MTRQITIQFDYEVTDEDAVRDAALIPMTDDGVEGFTDVTDIDRAAVIAFMRLASERLMAEPQSGLRVTHLTVVDGWPG